MEIRDVVPGLFLSGAIDDWEPVRRLGITAIVDLDGGIDPGLPETPGGILYVYFPILDDEQLPDQVQLFAVAGLVSELVRGGTKTLVHCLLGLNRSSLVAGVALTRMGMHGEEAYGHLVRLQSGALYNETFASYLRGLSRTG